MNKLINTIGGVVLFGILVKLSYVFVHLFAQLDGGGVVARVTGVTFAFASIYFVVKVRQNWLKGAVVLLDVSTILYYYLYEMLNVPIAYASIIVAAYSGLIVYYLGRIVSEQLAVGGVSDTNSQRMADERQRLVNEAKAIDSEIVKTRKRIRESRTSETEIRHRDSLSVLLAQAEELKLKLKMS